MIKIPAKGTGSPVVQLSFVEPGDLASNLHHTE